MEKLHSTVENIIEHTTCIINDILENHKMTSRALSDLHMHIKNLREAVWIHSMLVPTGGEEEIAPANVRPMTTKQSVVMKPTVTVSDK